MKRLFILLGVLLPFLTFSQETKIGPKQIRNGTAPDQILITGVDNTWGIDLLSNHAAAPFTVLNGLYLDVDEVKLGGSLTETTNVDGGSSFALTFTNLTTFSAAGAQGTLSLDGTGITAVIGAGASNGFEVTDLNNTGGIRYTGIYWDDYTLRSLIDKGYLLDELSRRGDTLTILLLGNSIAHGEDTAFVAGIDQVNSRFFAYDNTLWDWDIAIADTTGYGRTNIPRRFIGDVEGDGLGAERARRRSNIGYWMGKEHVERNPLNYSFLAVVTKGATPADSLVNGTPWDSLLVVLDSMAVDGIDYFDVVIFGGGVTEVNQNYRDRMIDLYEQLRDVAGVIDDRSIFMLPSYSTENSGHDVNVAILGLGDGGRPNFRAIEISRYLPTIDAVHPSAQAEKTTGQVAYHNYLGGIRDVSMDTLQNLSWGPSATRGSLDAFGTVMFIPNVLEDDVDSLRSTIWISPTSPVNFTNYCRNCLVIGDSNLYLANVNAIDNQIILGFHNNYNQVAARDSSLIVGRWNVDTKGEDIFGNWNDLGHVGSMIVGNSQSTTRMNQLMLGNPTTDYVVIGDYEYNQSTALGAGVDGWGWTFDNATDMFVLTDLSAIGGGSLTVREVDLTPSVSSVTTLQFDQADGFTVTDLTGGVAQIGFTQSNPLVSQGLVYDGDTIQIGGPLNEALSWDVNGHSFSLFNSSGISLSATGNSGFTVEDNDAISIKAGSANQVQINGLGSIKTVNIHADSTQLRMDDGISVIIDAQNNDTYSAWELGSNATSTAGGTYQRLLRIEQDGSLLLGLNPAFRSDLDTALVIDPATGELFLADLGAGAGDNLGNHTATQILNMGGFAVQDPSFVLFDDTNADTNDWSIGEGADGVLEIELDFTRVFLFNEDGSWGNSNYVLPAADGSNLQVLQTNGAGVVSWATVSGSGDNLGSHVATASLNMAGNDIDSVAIFQLFDTNADGAYWSAFEDSNGDLVIQDSGAGTDDWKITEAGVVSLGNAPATDNTEEHLLVWDSTTGAIEKREVSSLPSGSGGGSTEYWLLANGNQTTDSTLTAATWTNIRFAQETLNDASFTHSTTDSTQVFRIDSTGTYVVSVNVVIYNGGTNTRTDIHLKGQLAAVGTGATNWVDLSGCRGSHTTALFDDGAGEEDWVTLHIAEYGFSATANDRIRFQVKVEDTGWGYFSGSRITLKRIR